MKIAEVNVYFVRPRWGFVEIVTDSGIVGWGEAVLEGHAKAVLACVEEYRDYLIGKDHARMPLLRPLSDVPSRMVHGTFMK